MRSHVEIILNNWQRIVAALLLLASAGRSWSFSLLGPGGAEGNVAKDWQLAGPNGGWLIGYGFVGDIGAPVQLIEAYRWNTPVITYAFDESFIRFFGTNGMRAVDDAFRILNDLPAASAMSADLTEFPLSTLRQNYEATALGLMDLKSLTLTLLLEELGLAQAERWVWSIRDRDPVTGGGAVYSVIRYNYDPVTLAPSPYVNGTLYTYEIVEVPEGPIDAPYAEATEIQVVTDLPPNLSVTTVIPPGFFFTGLTRDDVGGLRFLLHPRNRVVETLLPGITPALPSGWLPILGTNFLGTNIAGITNVGGTNNLASTGIRGGVNKLTFKKVYFDSLLGGSFTPITNVFTDRVIRSNNTIAVERVMRPITRPDIVFTVEDMFETAAFRTGTAGWINNDALTPEGILGGPGIISPPITISYNMLFPLFFNSSPGFLTEPQAGGVLGLGGSFTWASFDGSTNAPIIYPQYLNFRVGDLRNAARNAGN